MLITHLISKVVSVLRPHFPCINMHKSVRCQFYLNFIMNDFLRNPHFITFFSCSRAEQFWKRIIFYVHPPHHCVSQSLVLKCGYLKKSFIINGLTSFSIAIYIKSLLCSFENCLVITIYFLLGFIFSFTITFFKENVKRHEKSCMLESGSRGRPLIRGWVPKFATGLIYQIRHKVHSF